MIQVANRQMTSIIGWIVAAALLLGINGSKLTSMRKSMYGRQSTEIMVAREKSRRLEEIFEKLKEQEIEYNKRLGRVVSFSTRMTIPIHRKPTASKGKENVIKKVEIKPPQLSGVMQVSDINGVFQSYAIIEGKRYREKERVAGFKIRKITSKGVLFTKRGNRWFVSTPSVPFSVNYREKTNVSTLSEEKTKITDSESQNFDQLKELSTNNVGIEN